MRLGGAGDLEQRHLRAERDALGAFERQQRLDHQQAEDVRLIRRAGQQHARPAAGGQRGDRLAQQALGQFSKQVLLEHREAAVLPGFADASGERRHGVVDKPEQAAAREALLHRLAVAGGIVRLDQAQQFAEVVTAGAGGGRARGGATRRQHGEFLCRSGEQFAGPVTLVHQALDQAQAVNLFRRIAALAIVVAGGCRKSVAALPDTQDVLGEPGVALDGGDVEGRCIHFLS